MLVLSSKIVFNLKFYVIDIVRKIKEEIVFICMLFISDMMNINDKTRELKRWRNIAIFGIFYISIDIAIALWELIFSLI